MRGMLQNILLILLGTGCAAVMAAESPNIIVILADDMGIDSVSAFNEQLGFKTPHIDALAQSGMSFTDAHSGSAVCTPTRYGLLTGRYAWRSRLKQYIIPKWDTPLIEEERLTIGSMLQQHGYHTACIGKWHLGWNWPFISTESIPVGNGNALKKTAAKGIDWTRPITGGPIERGFDYHFGDDVINWEPFVYIENDQALGTPDINNKWKAADSDWAENRVLPTLTSKAVSYIEKQAEDNKPFFLYFPMTSPHAPIAPSEKFKGKSGLSEYVDFVIETDDSVGQIVEAVNRSGIAQNTLIFFTADNGTALKFPLKDGSYTNGANFDAHVRGGKSDIWEGGHRVPFIVSWPGKIKGGSRNQTPICLTDIMATAAELVEYKLPDNAAEDSVSLFPALKGDTLTRGPIINHSIQGKFAIRSDNWKLAFCPGSGGWSSPTDKEAKKLKQPQIQLYNLDTDPLETQNLINENPELVQRLTARLHDLISNGRSTAGTPQPNSGETWCPEL